MPTHSPCSPQNASKPSSNNSANPKKKFVDGPLKNAAPPQKTTIMIEIILYLILPILFIILTKTTR